MACGGRVGVQRKGAKAQKDKEGGGGSSLLRSVDDAVDALPGLLLAEVDDGREPLVGDASIHE